MRSWVAVFGEEPVNLSLAGLLIIEKKKIVWATIAGVNIPVFEGADFAPFEYDLWSLPPWVDSAMDALQKIILFELEMEVLAEQSRRMSKELRTTNQRVNLFEKVKIPETKANIKKISIYLENQPDSISCPGQNF